jgi:hypothetical protein
MDEIEYYPEGGMIPLDESRPKGYYDNKIYLIIVILNCICGLLKIIGSISSLFFKGVVGEIRDTCKQLYNNY